MAVALDVAVPVHQVGEHVGLRVAQPPLDDAVLEPRLARREQGREDLVEAELRGDARLAGGHRRRGRDVDADPAVRRVVRVPAGVRARVVDEVRRDAGAALAEGLVAAQRAGLMHGTHLRRGDLSTMPHISAAARRRSRSHPSATIVRTKEAMRMGTHPPIGNESGCVRSHVRVPREGSRS